MYVAYAGACAISIFLTILKLIQNIKYNKNNNNDGIFLWMDKISINST